MFFEDDGIYRIRGIVSLSLSRTDKKACNSKEYVIFTDVAQYLSWIEETLAGAVPLSHQAVIAQKPVDLDKSLYFSD